MSKRKQDGVIYLPLSDGDAADLLMRAAANDIGLFVYLQPHKAKLIPYPWAAKTTPGERQCAEMIVPLLSQFAGRLISTPQIETVVDHYPAEYQDESHPWYDHYFKLDEPQKITREQVYWVDESTEPAIGTGNEPASGEEEMLAALFDPVTVKALEKMFPADGQWKSWAERAARNGLQPARDGRGVFNPYRAALWFLRQGIPGWDLSRCHRVLANNLPARSRYEAHQLTRERG